MGPDSPIAPIEALMVSIYIQKAKMGQPIGLQEGLDVANSLIKGTIWQDRLKAAQRLWKMHEASPNFGQLGQKYWKNFLRRNKQKISSQISVQLATTRKEWCTYANFERMYVLVYQAMLEAGIAIRLMDDTWMDWQGNIVGTEEEAFGLACKFFLKHPEYLIFVDEVGNNTNMKDGKRYGSKKSLGPTGQATKEEVSTTDTHFTTLGFTSATGQPIMCAQIFKGKINTLVQFGINKKIMKKPGIKQSLGTMKKE